DTEPKNSKKPEGNISDKCYPCSICGKIFDRPSKLERHKPVHTRKPKTVYQCQQCDKSFTQEEKLIRHQNCHSRTNKHPCPDCGKVFNRPSNKLNKLVRHKRMHTGEKPFTCSVCGKGFSESGHCKSEKYICNECGATFTRYKSLTKHQRTHTGERPYLCLTCGRRFSWSHSLSRHRRTHTHRQICRRQGEMEEDD
uniref:C2H2-type domain-containing protein n=1 Tax=Mola mola TaxID=94237 RepID=A0A3Q3W528_MOLML